MAPLLARTPDWSKPKCAGESLTDFYPQHSTMKTPFGINYTSMEPPFGVNYISTKGTPATEYAWSQIGQSAGK